MVNNRIKIIEYSLKADRLFYMIEKTYSSTDFASLNTF